MKPLQMVIGCGHENEINEQVRLGRLPSAFPPELRGHLATCRRCSDSLRISQAFHEARANSAHAANLQSPGLIWWKAQLRRRNSAVERVSRPILGAQIFALVLNVLIVGAVIISQAKVGAQWLLSLASQQRLRSLDFNLRGAFSSLTPAWSSNVLIPALIVLGVLGGVVLYLASDSGRMPD